MTMCRIYALVTMALLAACPARGEPSLPLPGQATLTEALGSVIAFDRPGQDG